LPFNPADSVINQDEHTAINKQNRAHRWMLAGGDDYELCFTAPVTNRRKIQLISRQVKVPLTRIGVIVEGSDCTVRAADGSIISIGEIGYDHFR
jgi:thiamine-monophosphate kinase